MEDINLPDLNGHETGVQETSEHEEARREEHELCEEPDDLADLPQVPPNTVSQSVSCLVILDGTPLNLHEHGNLAKLGRGSFRQLEFKLKLEYHPASYSRVVMAFIRNHPGGDRRQFWIGRMEFYLQSISELSCARQPKDRATISLNRDFNLEPGTVEAPEGCIYLSFRVDRVIFYYDPVTITTTVFKRQIKQMAEFADSVNKGSSKEVAFIVKDNAPSPAWEYTPNDTLPQSAPVVSTDQYLECDSNLNAFIAVAKFMEIKSDRLAPWFRLSPRQQLLNSRTILQVGKKYVVSGGRKVIRPELESVHPCVKFFDLRQYKVAQAYGTVDDAARVQAIANEMAKKQFRCYLFAFSQNKDDSGNPSAVAVAIPLGPNTHLLPRKGSDCKISISGLVRAKNPPYEVDIEADLPLFLHELISRAVQGYQDSDDFIEMYNVVKDGTSEEKIAEVRSDLKDIYVDAQTTGGAVDEEGLEDFVTKHAAHLQVPEVPDKDAEEKLFQWNARATDTPLPLLGGSFRVFIAKIPLEPWSESWGGERRRSNFGLEFPQEGENYGVYVQRTLEEEEAKSCTITVKTLEKTLRQEIQAHGEIQCRPSVPADAPGVSDLAVSIYNWLPTLELPPEGSESLIDHFDLFPGMKRAVDGNAPGHLQQMYDSFDESKKSTFSEHMRKIPFGLAAIPGTAACGKSLFVKFYAALHLLEELPEDSPPNKVLIIHPHNQALDDFELGFRRTLEKYGAPPEMFPRMERVHSIPTEVSAAMKSLSRGDLPTAESDELDATDHFLAEYVLTEFQRNAAEYSKQKGRNNFHTQSLHTSVLRDVQEHPNDYKYIINLQKIGRTRGLSKSNKTEAENMIKKIYEKKLRQAQIVFATPSAARETLFRKAFEPTLVIMDENARMRELTTIMCIASFPTAKLFMLLGDPRQLTPFTSSTPGEMKAPFDPQISISCLDRLFRAGVSFKGLVHNHRQYANLQQEPSTWFYKGSMQSSIAKADRFPPSVIRVQQIIRKLTGIPDSNRVIVDITNSKEERAFLSVKNERHAFYVLRALRYFYLDAKFTSLDESVLGSIAIIPFYDAQVTEIESLLRNRKVVHNLFGVTPAKLAERVRVSTLDSFQGGQADLVILDYTRSNRPGFTGDSHRNVVAHTRSVQGEIVLLRESVFGPGSGDSRSSANLRLMYRALDRESRVHKTIFYENCLDFGHEQKYCRGTAHCSTCFGEGHTMSACLMVKCIKCHGLGHIATHCYQDKLACKNCGAKGHFAKNCPNQRSLRHH